MQWPIVPVLLIEDLLKTPPTPQNSIYYLWQVLAPSLPFQVELKEGFIQHTQVCQYVHLDRKSAFKHQLRNCAGLANPVAFLRLRHLPALANRISHFHTLSTRVSQPWGCPLSCFLRGGRRKRQQKFFVPPGVR